MPFLYVYAHDEAPSLSGGLWYAYEINYKLLLSSHAVIAFVPAAGNDSENTRASSRILGMSMPVLHNSAQWPTSQLSITVGSASR